MRTLIEELQQYWTERGYQGRVVSIEHLHELRQAIEQAHDRGVFDEIFFQEELSGFSFSPPEELPEPTSLMVAAVPVPQTRLVFTWQGKAQEINLPPTYARYRARSRSTVDDLASFLAARGHRVAAAEIPLKLLAVCSGLAEYGKNNISYVPGMGSFLQLVGCFSDLPCPQDGWREAKMMDRCETCQACLRTCPTQAISGGRFLLHAERCLTFHNERVNEFPSWIDPSWHNSLIGCMDCQRVCPENKSFLPWIEEGAAFSEDETALFLQSSALEQLPEATADKVKQLGLSEDLNILSRNLRAILGSR